ncbi:DinB family protein [Planosporangium sp. 12N6]|uniref:DinB family protein n=1 Tax=Planosporangium spinosum TaxID=3402278 RepID=UPI003CF88651
MTSSQTDRSVPAPLLVTTGDERAVLDAFLDFHRGVVRSKASGVSDEDARRRLVGSQTTLAGLVKHLTVVERSWFPHLLTGAAFGQEAGDGGEEVTGFEVGPHESIEDLIAAYDRACAVSREVAAGFPLDHVVHHPQVGPVSLRWIMVHVVEETARHAGHADILREQTDGATGVTG